LLIIINDNEYFLRDEDTTLIFDKGTNKYYGSHLYF
jgi:hypothetical protein